MSATASDHRSSFFTPQRAPPGERLRVEALSKELNVHFDKERRVQSGEPTLNLRIDDRQHVVPSSLAVIFRDIVDALAHGDMVTLIPSHRELTTQEAADILNVSRQYVVQLLDEDAIPYTRVNKHRRIRADDLIEFKLRRDAKRREALRELTQDAQNMGSYFGKK